MYGVIGINFVDHFLNQGAPAKHKSAETPIGHESGNANINDITLAEALNIPNRFSDLGMAVTTSE